MVFDCISPPPTHQVVRCSKRYVHDWRTCPYAHPTENARRRDPREFRYYAIPCPEYKKGICLLGDACPYSHGVYECWLHPSKYCTQLCKDGEQCRRPVCFFAHSPQDLRQADTQYDPLPEDLERAEAFRMQQQASAKMQQTINRSAASNLAACHPTLQAVLEASLADPEATLLRLAAAQTQQAQQQQQAPLLLSGSPPRAGRFSLDALYASGGRGGGVVGNGMLPPHGNGIHGNGMLPNAANGMHGMVQPAAPVSNGQGCSSPTSSHSSGDSLQQALAGAVSNGNAGVPSRRSVDSTGSNGPRMSNAMARKLGLAPTRECKRPGVAAAAAAAAAVAAVSSRASLDGSSHVDSLRSFGSVPANGFQVSCVFFIWVACIKCAGNSHYPFVSNNHNRMGLRCSHRPARCCRPCTPATWICKKPRSLPAFRWTRPWHTQSMPCKMHSSSSSCRPCLPSCRGCNCRGCRPMEWKALTWPP